MSTKQEVCKKIKEFSNKIAFVEIKYYGNGDSFGDFNHITAFDSNKNEIKEIPIDYNMLMDIVENYCYEILDNSRNVDFNNEGCEGYITIDINNMITTLDNFRVFTDTESTGQERY